MTEEITFEEFQKVDIRVGIILTAEAVPKSKKLLKFSVYLGPELSIRTILAGVATAYAPESLVGVKVLVVVNLAPRNMMGIESHGMLLAVDTNPLGPLDPTRGLAMITPPDDALPGVRVG